MATRPASDPVSVPAGIAVLCVLALATGLALAARRAVRARDPRDGGRASSARSSCWCASPERATEAPARSGAPRSTPASAPPHRTGSVVGSQCVHGAGVDPAPDHRPRTPVHTIERRARARSGARVERRPAPGRRVERLPVRRGPPAHHWLCAICAGRRRSQAAPNDDLVAGPSPPHLSNRGYAIGGSQRQRFVVGSYATPRLDRLSIRSARRRHRSSESFLDPSHTIVPTEARRRHRSRACARCVGARTCTRPHPRSRRARRVRVGTGASREDQLAVPRPGAHRVPSGESGDGGRSTPRVRRAACTRPRPRRRRRHNSRRPSRSSACRSRPRPTGRPRRPADREGAANGSWPGRYAVFVTPHNRSASVPSQTVRLDPRVEASRRDRAAARKILQLSVAGS